MTGTETTPLHPFQDDLSCLKADQRLAHYTHQLDSTLDNNDSFILPEVTSAKPEINTIVSSPCPSLSTITSSSPSSTRTSRLSLPSIWNNNNNSGDSYSVFDSSCLSSASPIWSYSLCDLPMSPNKSTTTTETNTPPSPCGYQQSSPNSLRSIWCSPSMNQQQQEQQPSRYRRMSLSDYNACSDDRSPLVPETQHTAKGYRNGDHASSYGRRHSVAGPFIPKTTNKNSNVYRWMQDSHWPSYLGGAVNDSPMKAIDEDETFLYANTQYSRYQQHILNKGILDHIDEYFGGGNKKTRGRDSIHAAVPSSNTGLPHTLGPSYLPNVKKGAYPATSLATPPPTTTTTSSSSSLDTNFGKTMTAGGDAIAFGCSNLLMGKGIPLHHFLDSNTLLYLVEFKTNRTDICYIMQRDASLPQIGDLVITEADRGRDLGKVMNILTANTIIQKQQQQQQQQQDDAKAMVDGTDVRSTNDDDGGHYLTNEDDQLLVSQQQKCQVKRLYRLANSEETASLTIKQLDEEKALLVCQAKIQQKELSMQVVNAEYQWDRRKLTFYFMADQRIDFRELVRELFKTYKTRIWMCALKSDANSKLTAL